MIAANFTAEPIAETLQFWMRELGWREAVRFAPFDQVFQTLLDPAGIFARNEPGGLNVVLVKPDVWSEDDRMELLEYLEQHRFAAPVVLVWCPPGESPRLAVKATGVEVMTSEEILAQYPVERVLDEVADRAGKVPYTREAFTAIGTAVVRRWHALRQTTAKVIAVDADQTLWSGVCGEDGPRGVVVSEAQQAFQRALLAQREQGKLLMLASKNNEADVWETFAENPGMVLRREHLVDARVNWHPKSSNLAEAAHDLGLGLDSFVFIDDDRRECAEVASGASGVKVLPLAGGEPAELLAHFWPLDQLKVTSEDRQRQQYYQEAAERSRFESKSRTFAEFLAGLQLVVEFEPLGQAASLARAAQLTQRTNQMNASSRRRTEAEIGAWVSEAKREGWAVSVRDRFGDYGLVGLALADFNDGVARVDTFLLSCRALGRGVEHRMMRHVAERARAHGLERVEVELIETARNAPAREFVGSMPGREVAALLDWEYRPETKPGKPREENGAKATASASVTDADYGRIARDLRTVSAIRAAMLRGRGPAELPQGTELEVRVAAIWVELLKLERVTLDEDFFDLGGHSLLAVQLLARLHEEFGIELPQSAVYDGRLTVRELARSIELEQLGAGGLSAADYEALLDEIDQLSEEEVRALLERESGRQ